MIQWDRENHSGNGGQQQASPAEPTCFLVPSFLLHRILNQQFRDVQDLSVPP